MHFLKFNTAVTVNVGPAVDAIDGVTPETTLALGTADQARLFKHDGAAIVDITGRTLTSLGGSGAAGWYSLGLTTADTGTLGSVTIIIQDSSLMLPIFKEFTVLSPNIYDSLVGGGDVLQTDITQVGGVAQNGTDFADLIANAYDPANNRINADITAINTNATAASQLEASSDTIITGSVTATLLGDLIFSTSLSATYTTDDALVGRTFIFRSNTTTSALRGAPRTISSYANATGEITLNAPLSTDVVSGDTFVIV